MELVEGITLKKYIESVAKYLLRKLLALQFRLLTDLMQHISIILSTGILSHRTLLYLRKARSR